MRKPRRSPRRIKLRSNQFWGIRSGTITKSGERIFKIKKWGGGVNNGKLPSRKARTYKNAKLSRMSILHGAVRFVQKGRKERVGA